VADGDDDSADQEQGDGAELVDEGASGIERHPDMSFAAEVAPNLIDDQKAFNALRASLAPVACWRLEDHRFEFDSSFILPDTRDDLVKLATMFDDYKDSPMSLFGHADPVGPADYNKKLSGFRAKSTYALLTRNLDFWEELHNEHGWKLTSSQQILMFLDGERVDADPDFEPYLGPADGKDSPVFKTAVKRFQTDNGLAVDGVVGKNTRRKLFELYMDAICVKASGDPFKVDPSAFLGKGADAKGKGDFQGCSEFNPVIILSNDQEKDFKDTNDKDGRNAANAPNRRVVMYFFHPKLEIDVKKWPCPRASEGAADCRKRFFSDDKTRTAPDEHEMKDYKKTRKTFACRFYDRFAFHSPCEAGFEEWVVQLLRPGTGKITTHEPLAGVLFEARGSGRVTRGTTDANGLLRVRVRDKKEAIAVGLTIPVPPPPDDGNDKNKSSGDGTVTVREPIKALLSLTAGDLLELGALTDLPPIVQRLRNLGYGPSDIAKWATDAGALKKALTAFQTDHDLQASGEEDDDTAAKLREIYGS